MASILCRKGETFPNSHRHDSVTAVRVCQGAPASWERNTQKSPVSGTDRIVEGVKDARNVYLNPKGAPAQLDTFKPKTYLARNGLSHTFGEANKDRPAPYRVDSDLEAKVPGGRYAIHLDDVTKFYRVRKVTKGIYAGRTFVDVQAGDETYPVLNASKRAEILTAIAADVRAASARYGKALGACGVCGRTLTDEVSIAKGIGPVCEKRLS